MEICSFNVYVKSGRPEPGLQPPSLVTHSYLVLDRSHRPLARGMHQICTCCALDRIQHVHAANHKCAHACATHSICARRVNLRLGATFGHLAAAALLR